MQTLLYTCLRATQGASFGKLSSALYIFWTFKVFMKFCTHFLAQIKIKSYLSKFENKLRCIMMRIVLEIAFGVKQYVQICRPFCDVINRIDTAALYVNTLHCCEDGFLKKVFCC